MDGSTGLLNVKLGFVTIFTTRNRPAGRPKSSVMSGDQIGVHHDGDFMFLASGGKRLDVGMGDDTPNAEYATQRPSGENAAVIRPGASMPL